MTPQFWQSFLAAEFPTPKSRALLEELDSFAGDPNAFLTQRGRLSEGESRRIRFAFEIDLEEAFQAGIRLIERPNYSEMLSQSGAALPAMFVWGQEEAIQGPCIAIVGTRSATTYGKACAQKFAEAFARCGVTVVSGGALGIDAAAHKGALAAEGRTVAVLAGGVDRTYPAVHKQLFEQIRQNGCLVSQFAIGAIPNEYKFLVRNTLIAALSIAVVVIEAPAKSGAIHTAVAASEMGREVFVVPANIDMLSFRGSFNLLRDGATLAYHPDQVMESLGISIREQEVRQEPASSLGEAILSVLTSNPLSTELIVQRTGVDTSEVLSELTMLELDGRVIRDATGYALKP